MTAVIWWLIAVIVFLVLEAATVALVSIWFAGGALLAMIAAALGAGTAVQLVVFFVSSCALLALMWPLARKKMSGRHVRTNADRLIGREVLVTEQIENLKETGEIKVNGVLWTAKCTTGERVEAGGHVTIERVEGAKLYVRPAKCPCTKA